MKQDGQPNPTFYYVHPDHLGSLAIITDANGGIQQKCTYDAWGKRTLVQGSLIFDRGFTSHEHLEEFALVNMNGRMYDPTLGRFLSPDPYVQDPLFSQSFNRYAYCHNNPLIFTDPDGEFPWLAVAIGAIIGGITGHKIGKAHGATGWGMAGYIFGGAVIGGFAGYAGAAVYTASTGFVAGAGGFAAGFNAGMLSGMAAGAINGAGMAILGGGSFSDVMAGMTMGAWFGGVMGGIAGGITEGVAKLAAHYQRVKMGPEGLWAMVDNPGQCIDLGDNLLQNRYSIPEVVITARMPLHLTPIAQSIHGAHHAFWNAAPTRAVTTVLTSMIGGGIISGYKWAYSAVKGVRAANTAASGGMTDLQLITKAAQKAETAIGGTGRFAGTAKHTYAKNLLSRYQGIYGDRGLSLGSNYFNGPAGKGFLDIVSHRTMTIYDFKFGNAVMSNSQFLKYSNSFPGYSIRIIRP